jgi:hypothetical protein
MKQKLAVAFFAMTMLSGCYTYVCPTYTVKPEKADQLKVEKSADNAQKKVEQAS